MTSMRSSVSDIPMSYPFKVCFAGFESDTLRLHRAGWKISAEQNLSLRNGMPTVRLAFRHDGLRLTALTDEVVLDRKLYGLIHNEREKLWGFYGEIVFNVRYVAPEIHIQTHGMMRDMEFSWKAVDPVPQMQTYRHNLNDIAMFKTIDVGDGVELYVEEKSVGELLDLIRTKQSVTQKELREKHRKAQERERVQAQLDEFQPARNIKASILTLAV